MTKADDWTDPYFGITHHKPTQYPRQATIHVTNVEGYDCRVLYEGVRPNAEALYLDFTRAIDGEPRHGFSNPLTKTFFGKRCVAQAKAWLLQIITKGTA